MSKIENELALHLRAAGLQPEREYRFAAVAAGGAGKGVRARLEAAGLKDWRFDFAFPDQMLAVECEGGGWTAGRHTRGAGFAEDLRKYDAAMRMGWSIYRCDARMVRQGRALRTIELLLRA